MLPDDVLQVAQTVTNVLPRPQELRDNPDKRNVVHQQTNALLSVIDNMLED
jgi:hypothetical protein